MDRDRHGSFGNSYNGRSNGPGHAAHHNPQQQQSQQSHHHQSHHHQQGNSASSPAPEFDLQAESAFPPLPGLEAGASGASQSPATGKKHFSHLLAKRLCFIWFLVRIQVLQVR